MPIIYVFTKVKHFFELHKKSKENFVIKTLNLLFNILNYKLKKVKSDIEINIPNISHWMLSKE